MAPERARASRRLGLLLLIIGSAFALAVVAELAGRWVLARKVGPWAVDGPEKIEPDGPDPLLGWSADQKKSRQNKYGPGRHKTYNSLGMRATEEYPIEAPADIYRVVCVGDTFTFGAGLGDDETYPEQMERLRPSLQTINMGMGAYAVDQAVLWYERDGLLLEHDLVLLAFTEDAYRRMAVAAFLWVMPKPRLILTEAGELELTNVPVPSWGLRGYWRDFPRSTAAYKVAYQLLDERWVQNHYDPVAVASRLYARVRDAAAEAGRSVVLVHLPTTPHLLEPCAGGEGFCKKPGRAEIAVRLEGLAGALELPFIDVTPAFRKVQDEGELDPYFQPDQKYSPEGASLVARHLVERLSRLVPGFPSEPAVEGP